MRLIVWIFSILLLSVFNSSYINAAELNKNKLLKEIIISWHKIKKDYKTWDKINKQIDRYFIRLRLEWKKTRKAKLEDIKSRLWNKLISLRAKNKLTSKETKLKNLISNLYLRVILELSI